MPAVQIEFVRPRILLYRLFDVASEIRLDRARELLAGAATPLKLSRDRSRYLEIPEAPLTVHLGAREVTLESGRTCSLDAFARCFHFGVMSVRYEAELPSPARGMDVASLCREFEDSQMLGDHARREVEQLAGRLGAALESPHTWAGLETYTVLLGSAASGVVSLASLNQTEAIARILLAETSPEPLSAQEIADATQHWYSYAENDLCVVDWNSAVVIAPDASRDIPDILEFATAQLLEFRYYDDLVDREMEALHDLLALQQRKRTFGLLGGPYRRLSRKLNRRLVETVEFVERVDNAIKVVADSYLARVYQGALRSFRVPEWQAGVLRKQDLIRQVSEVLMGESQARLGHVLEAVVVLLILYEIVAPLIRSVWLR